MEKSVITNESFKNGVNIIHKYIPENQRFGFNVTIIDETNVCFGDYDWVTDEFDKNMLIGLGWYEYKKKWAFKSHIN